MKRIYPWLKMFLLTGSLLAPSASCLATSAPPAADPDVKYVSAGIGSDDPLEIEALRHRHRLQLVFALRGSGAFLADVKVHIRDASGATVLAVNSSGPLFFATLPPGQYRIEAEYRGSALRQSTSLTAGGRRDLYFYWDHE